MNKKLLKKYVYMTFFSKSKRLKKKAWRRAIELSGYDSEGIINYANLALFIKKYRWKIC